MKTTRQPREPRRRGRPAASVYTEDYTVRLEPEVAEWAKTLPGGLSQEIRVHLRHLYDQAQSRARSQSHFKTSQAAEVEGEVDADTRRRNDQAFADWGMRENLTDQQKRALLAFTSEEQSSANSTDRGIIQDLLMRYQLRKE